MFCSKCGVPNRDDANYCQACGAGLKANLMQAAATVIASDSVPNHLWAAIVATVFCSFPFGILAIVYAGRVNNCLARGDIEGARAASRTANIWCWVSLVVGLAFYVLGFAVFFMKSAMHELRVP